MRASVSTRVPMSRPTITSGSRAGELALATHQLVAHLGDARDERDVRLDLGRAQRVRDVHPGHLDARHGRLRPRDIEVERAHERDHGGGVVRVHAGVQHRERAGAVHQARVEEAVAQALRERAPDDALARGGGAIDGDAAGAGSTLWLDAWSRRPGRCAVSGAPSMPVCAGPTCAAADDSARTDRALAGQRHARCARRWPRVRRACAAPSARRG